MKRVQINVSGFIYETTNWCIERYPKTLLGDPKKRSQYYLDKENVYFFDRHRLAFEGILMYYQTYGRVKCPENVPEQVFQTELEFFKIDCQYLKSAVEARKYVLDKKTMKAAINHTSKQRIWQMLQDPSSSMVAQALSTVSLLVTLSSIVLACINPGDNQEKERFQYALFPLEMSCFLWFTSEYLLRLCTCPNKITFLRSWIDITDLITLLVFYSSLALTSIQASSTSVLRIFRLANAFRVFRLTRFSNGLRLLIYTIYTSRTDLQLLSGFLAFFIIISGSIVYFAEVDDNKMFRDGGIFDGIWFSLISCTTVGYGDIVPITVTGKLVSSLTITFGAMFVLLPVLKLVNSFSDALEITRTLLHDSEENQVSLTSKLGINKMTTNKKTATL